MRLQAKICGISTPETLAAAAAHGARYVGFVFYPKSPRYVGPELAAQLARQAPTGVRTVGLFVTPDDELLDTVVSQVPLDMIQLHGDETPERVAEIRRNVSMPVMKAIRIASDTDLDQVSAFEPAVDHLLFDAKLPKNVASLPGGNGVAFDWTLLANRNWSKPWMLSGGLTADNLADAVRTTGAVAVDTSSGVEDRPGNKTPALIRAFLAEAAQL
ncbi:MAG: phosphoribosylanthranilate isomerase [Pseudomonadota bacterium]